MLRLGAGGLVLALAGCIGDDGTIADPTPTATPAPTPTSIVDTATFDVGSFSQVDWNDEDPWSGAVLDVFASAEAVDRPEFDDLDEERRTSLEGFVDETDFTSSIVLFLGVYGPNGCVGVDVESVAIESDTLVGEAGAVSTRESGEACRDVVTFPTALVRVTFDAGQPGAVSMTVTDGAGETFTFDRTL